jgi:hypothetical protein
MSAAWVSMSWRIRSARKSVISSRDRSQLSSIALPAASIRSSVCCWLSVT